MLTPEQAKLFADEWINAWNAHDLDAILEHYSEDVEFTSPVIIQLLNNLSGTLHGKEDLRAYFRKGLETFPDLNFGLLWVLTGVNSVTLLYRSLGRSRHNLLAAETMELNEQGQAARVWVHYAESEG